MQSFHLRREARGGGGGAETCPEARAKASPEARGFDLGKEQEAGGDAEGPGDQAARLLRALRRRGACRGTQHKRLCCPVVPGGGSSKKREGLAEGGDRKCKT